MSISLNAQAASNNINTSLNWDNHDDEEKLSGEIEYHHPTLQEPSQQT